VEFLVVLGIGILFSRTFAAEAYVVPTGSMAPTLLGMHREYLCPNCKIRFNLGMDEEGRSGRPICPNCGQAELDRASAIECNGDRLLVQKYLFDLRLPRRWEVAVFQNPSDPDQAYVKRIVALPGESVQIKDGDVYVDGRIARKSLIDQRAMRIAVYDNNFLPIDSDRYPRWVFRNRRVRADQQAGGWRSEGTRFLHVSRESPDNVLDWLEYRHWQPEQATYGPVRDFTPYNGGDVASENRVNDLMLEARVSIRPGTSDLAVRFGAGADRIVVSVPVDGTGEPIVRQNGKKLAVLNAKPLLRSSPARAPRSSRLEASWMDRRLIVALDGELVFDPVDLEEEPGYAPNASPLGVGVEGRGEVELSDVRIFRDVYYTDSLSNATRRPFAVGSPFRLGSDEYFVLGDNSPVSNDSRFWTTSPIVRSELFLGKPFLVHLPSQAVPLRVWGRDHYWIPDPRRIRYIR
jgi:signal peptidase I